MNITIQITQQSMRAKYPNAMQRHVHVTVFTETPALTLAVIEGVRKAGFDLTHTPPPLSRASYKCVEHLGGRHFEFFAVDETIPPPEPAEETVKA